MARKEHFENHIWKDMYSPEDLELYSHYARETKVGPAPALLLIDFYMECFRGGDRHPYELAKKWPSTCGSYAFRTLEPTKRLIAAARKAGLPIFYSTGEDRPNSKILTTTTGTGVTHRRAAANRQPDDYAIHPDLAPEPEDVVIYKQRASCFYGTSLLLQLSKLGIRSLIVGGGTASGCMRAGVLDAQSAGFHVSIVEECVFDRADTPLKSNLFDLGHKYADVMHLDEVLAHLGTLAPAQAAE